MNARDVRAWRTRDSQSGAGKGSALGGLTNVRRVCLNVREVYWLQVRQTNKALICTFYEYSDTAVCYGEIAAGVPGPADAPVPSLDGSLCSWPRCEPAPSFHKPNTSAPVTALLPTQSATPAMEARPSRLPADGPALPMGLSEIPFTLPQLSTPVPLWTSLNALAAASINSRVDLSRTGPLLISKAGDWPWNSGIGMEYSQWM
ncbi:hypothetical protein SKAU_G00338000 [Synaphobranchus kaupii]|uniref:Uncharacterized protein n=1 Tax=Synaphobranchus kaupii TaxID=118154 RepID=A0A9Q1EMD4_SYNKA|nr:hypothetical protein SKAU_G00338000 [Synaphobranchus kaupii]